MARQKTGILIVAGAGWVEFRKPIPVTAVSGPTPTVTHDAWSLTLEQAEELLSRLPALLASAIEEARLKREEEKQLRAATLEKELAALRAPGGITGSSPR
jgi:hypothetical protein